MSEPNDTRQGKHRKPSHDWWSIYVMLLILAGGLGAATFGLIAGAA